MTTLLGLVSELQRVRLLTEWQHAVDKFTTGVRDLCDKSNLAEDCAARILNYVEINWCTERCRST
jgi:hypothetical protein